MGWGDGDMQHCVRVLGWYGSTLTDMRPIAAPTHDWGRRRGQSAL